MRAIDLGQDSVRIVEVPDPEPGNRDLLVRVEAAGLNAGDMHHRKGIHRPGDPTDGISIRGHEFAGTVVKVGKDTKRFVIGDKVMGLSHTQEGLAELALIPESMAMPIPDSLPIAAAGAFPEAFCVADDALFSICGMGAGDRVLVTGAAGGVGMAAVQLAAATGAIAVGSARDQKTWPSLQEFGVITCLPADELKNGPYDVIIELVNRNDLEKNLRALAPNGNICLIGSVASFAPANDGMLMKRPDKSVEVDLQLLRNARGHLHADGMGTRTIEEKALVARRVEHRVFPQFDRGAARVLIDSEFAFNDAKAAFERFQEGGKLGKVVITNF